MAHYEARAKDIRKSVPILQKGGFTPALLTLLAIRIVLLHKLRFVQSFNSPTVYLDVGSDKANNKDRGQNSEMLGMCCVGKIVTSLCHR